MPIKALIFDLGGVLLRTDDRRSRIQLADSLGMAVEVLEKLVFWSETGIAAQRGEISAEQHWQAVGKSLNLRPDEIEPVRSAFFAGDVIDRNLLDFIDSLKPRFRTALLSNAFSNARHWLIELHGLDRFFDPIVISAEEGIMKPDAEIYRRTLERCGVQANEAVFVDDFIQNIRGAQEAGLRTIWFRGRDQAIADMQRLLALPAP